MATNTEELAEYPRAEANKKAADKEASEKAWYERIFNFFIDYFPDLGSILMWGALLIGGYYLAHTERGKELLNGIFGEEKVSNALNKIDAFIGKMLAETGIETSLGEQASNKIALGLTADAARSDMQNKFGLTAAQARILAPDEAGWQETRAIVAANGSFLAPTSDKILYAFLLQKPEMARALAATITGAGGAGAGTQEILKSLRRIVADPVRLATLLNTDNHANTIALLHEFAPSITPEQLNSIIDAGLVDGQPSNDFIAFIGSALTPDETGVLPVGSALKYYAGKNPAVQKIMLDIAMGASPETPDSPLANQATRAALVDLRTRLGDEKFSRLLAVVDGGNEAEIMQLALENRAPLLAVLDSVNGEKLPPEMLAQLRQLKKIPVAAVAPSLAILAKGIDPRGIEKIFAGGDSTAVVGNLFNPQNRELLIAAGTENVAALAAAYNPQVAAVLTGNNINAMMQAAASISGNRGNVDEHAGVTVTAAFADMFIHNDPVALKGLDGDQFADFMGDNRNIDALNKLLAATHGREATAAAVLKHWGVIEALAADRKTGAPLLRAQLVAMNEKPSVDSCKGQESDWIDEIKSTWDYLTGVSTVIGINADEIKALKQDLKAAQCAAIASPTTLAPAGEFAAR